MYHLCGGVWECPWCDRLYCHCINGNCPTCGFPKYLRGEPRLVTDTGEIQAYMAKHYTVLTWEDWKKKQDNGLG